MCCDPDYPPAPLTLVQELETTDSREGASHSASPPLSPLHPLRVPAHAGWQRTRIAVWHGLQDAQVSETRLLSFALCRAHPILQQSRADKTVFRLTPSSCHDRFCRTCAAARAAQIQHALVGRLHDRKHRRITLTLKSSDLPLGEQLTRLTACFKLLRKTPLWADRIPGGIWFFETTYNHDRHQWHPHLHILATGCYVKRELLSAAWEDVTGDSCVTDIRKIDDLEHAAYYAAKYAAKGISLELAHDRHLFREAVLATRGRRLWHTFGDYRGLKLAPASEAQEWQSVARMDGGARPPTVPLVIWQMAQDRVKAWWLAPTSDPWVYAAPEAAAVDVQPNLPPPDWLRLASRGYAAADCVRWPTGSRGVWLASACESPGRFQASAVGGLVAALAGAALLRPASLGFKRNAAGWGLLHPAARPPARPAPRAPWLRQSTRRGGAGRRAGWWRSAIEARNTRAPLRRRRRRKRRRTAALATPVSYSHTITGSAPGPVRARRVATHGIHTARPSPTSIAATTNTIVRPPGSLQCHSLDPPGALPPPGGRIFGKRRPAGLLGGSTAAPKPPLTSFPRFGKGLDVHGAC
jgi:hypothetical protein